MLGDIIIRKASESEIDRLLEIWIEKEKSLESRGIAVWDPKQFTKANLKEKYQCPEYYIGLVGDEIIGGFILIEKDIHFWPGKENDRAFYFHK